MSKKWNFKAPLSRGIAPRQAHADVPEGLWERELARNALAAAAEGYSFPTNLDRDPPLGGLAPKTQFSLVYEALTNGMSAKDVEAALDVQSSKRMT